MDTIIGIRGIGQHIFSFLATSQILQCGLINRQWSVAVTHVMTIHRPRMCRQWFLDQGFDKAFMCDMKTKHAWFTGSACQKANGEFMRGQCNDVDIVMPLPPTLDIHSEWIKMLEKGGWSRQQRQDDEPDNKYDGFFNVVPFERKQPKQIQKLDIILIHDTIADFISRFTLSAQSIAFDGWNKVMVCRQAGYMARMGPLIGRSYHIGRSNKTSEKINRYIAQRGVTVFHPVEFEMRRLCRNGRMPEAKNVHEWIRNHPLRLNSQRLNEAIQAAEKQKYGYRLRRDPGVHVKIEDIPEYMFFRDGIMFRQSDPEWPALLLVDAKECGQQTLKHQRNAHRDDQFFFQTIAPSYVLDPQTSMLKQTTSSLKPLAFFLRLEQTIGADGFSKHHCVVVCVGIVGEHDSKDQPVKFDYKREPAVRTSLLSWLEQHPDGKTRPPRPYRECFLGHQMRVDTGLHFFDANQDVLDDNGLVLETKTSPRPDSDLYFVPLPKGAYFFQQLNMLPRDIKIPHNDEIACYEWDGCTFQLTTRAIGGVNGFDKLPAEPVICVIYKNKWVALLCETQGGATLDDYFDWCPRQAANQMQTSGSKRRKLN